MPRVIHRTLRTYIHIFIYVHMYVYCPSLPISYCPLPIALGLLSMQLWVCNDKLVEIVGEKEVLEGGFMRYSRGTFSESELPLSYDAFLENTRGCAHSINWLRDQRFEQGMTTRAGARAGARVGPRPVRRGPGPGPGRAGPGPLGPGPEPGPVGPGPVLHTYTSICIYNVYIYICFHQYI